MRVSYTVTGDNITLFYKGKIFSIPSSSSRFAELKEHLKLPKHDSYFIESIVNIRSMVERFSQGNVKIYGDEVHYKGMPVVNSLAERLVQLIDDGFEVTPWINFMENVMLNPSKDSRERLFTFLEKNKSPITEDGHFIGFKRIRPDWTDIYTGKMDNSVGNIVEMPRENVDENNKNTCSHGLHVAASIYLDTGPTQFTDTVNSRTVVVKVNPRDVVAVPPDYNETKMRTCRYEVLSEVEVGQIKEIESQNVYGSAPTRVGFLEENKNADFGKIDEDAIKNIKGIVKTYKIDLGSGYEYNVYVLDKNTFKSYSFCIAKDLYDAVPNSIISNGVKEGTGLFYEYAEGEFMTYSPEENTFCVEAYVDNDDADDYYDNLDRLLDDRVGEEDEEKVQDELTFVRGNATYTKTQVLDGVARFGSITKWAKDQGIPRSTAQDWVKKIINS